MRVEVGAVGVVTRVWDMGSILLEGRAYKPVGLRFWPMQQIGVGKEIADSVVVGVGSDPRAVLWSDQLGTVLGLEEVVETVGIVANIL